MSWDRAREELPPDWRHLPRRDLTQEGERLARMVRESQGRDEWGIRRAKARGEGWISADEAMASDSLESDPRRELYRGIMEAAPRIRAEAMRNSAKYRRKKKNGDSNE